VSGVSSFAKGLGLADSERVRDGHTPGAPAPPAVAQAPSTEAGSETEIVPLSPGLPSGQAGDAAADGASSAPGAGDRMRSVKTDGLGVVLRTAPREDARVPRG